MTDLLYISFDKDENKQETGLCVGRVNKDGSHTILKMELDSQANTLYKILTDQSVKAIPKDQYETRLKADMVAMLTEIQLEIEEHEESIIGHYGKETKESDFPSHKIERNNGRKECVDLIQQKIDKLNCGCRMESEVQDADSD